MFREIFLIVFVALIYAHMPVNAILFCHFVNLNTLFLTVLCILYVYFVSVHAHAVLFLYVYAIFWFFNVAHAFVAFLYFFVFVFVQVAVFACFKPFYVDFMAVIDEKKRKKIKKLKNIGVEVYAADSRKSNFVISVAKRCAIHYENDICIKGEEIRLLNREELHEAVKICRLFSECGVKENQNIKNAVKEEFSLVSLDEINTEREVIKYLFKNTQCFLALSCILSCVCLAADVLFKEM